MIGHLDRHVPYDPKLRGGGGAYKKSDPLYGIYCPEEGIIAYNIGDITLPAGTAIDISDIPVRYCCVVMDSQTLKVTTIIKGGSEIQRAQAS